MSQTPLLKQSKSKCNPSEITLRSLTLSDSDVDHFMVWATNEKPPSPKNPRSAPAVQSATCCLPKIRAMTGAEVKLVMVWDLSTDVEGLLPKL
ncbi:hypothetical protein LguiB_013564 [Lonicera macranthoides]